MDWKAFQGTLSNGLRFCEPSCWDDGFEKRFYGADYTAITHATGVFPRQVYACCMALEGNCEAAWKIYGKGGVCVRLTIRRSVFLDILARHAKNSSMDAYEGKIIYLRKYTLSNLHLPKKSGAISIHEALFNRDVFTLDDFLSLLLMKRNDFEYEKEVRYFLVPQNNEEQDKHYLSLENDDWNNLVEKVTLVAPLSGKEGDSSEDLEQCRREIQERFPNIPVEIYNPNEDEEIAQNEHIAIVP